MADMNTLKGSQKKYLRGLAHSLKPLIIIGHDGITPSVIKFMEKVLYDHELVKVRFNKLKEEKKQLIEELSEATNSEVVGTIGNIAIFYKMNPEEDKRKIKVCS